MPPALALDTSGIDIDPNSTGVQVLESSTLQLKSTINDDVQVRNVEVLVNGSVVANDVLFPFDLSAILPTIAANGSDAMTVQIRATDTGGKVTTSALVNLKLVPDTTPPTLIASDPADNAARGLAFRAITLTFSESLDESTVTETNFQLIGASGAIVPIDIQFRAGGRIVQLTYPALTPDAYQIVLIGPNITDRAGNPLSADNLVRRVTIKAATVGSILPAGFGMTLQTGIPEKCPGQRMMCTSAWRGEQQSPIAKARPKFEVSYPTIRLQSRAGSLPPLKRSA